ncbi:repeat domain (List_Bact_rpt), partial [Lachnospiraceae bacterium KH1T2]
MLNVKSSAANEDELPKEADEDDKHHSVVLDTNFEGSNFISFDVFNLDITNIIPKVKTGTTVSIGQISCTKENTPVKISIDPEALDSDDYLYRLYYDKKTEQNGVTTITQQKVWDFTKDTPIFTDESTSVVSNQVLNLRCIKRNSSEIELNVGFDGSKYVTTANTDAATAITELLEDAASLTGITLTLPESSEEAETLEITDKSGLPNALADAANKGIPVTLKLNSDTSIEFPVEATTYAAPIVFTAKRTEKTLDTFKDKEDTSYTYKGYAGVFSVVNDSPETDITDKFTFTLYDLPSNLTKKETGNTKYTTFSQIGDATNGVRPVSTTLSNYGTEAFTTDNAVKFTPPADYTTGDIKDATWYLLDCEVVTNHIYFDANVPEGFTFEYDEDSLAKNYPSVYAVSDNKTTLVASIPQGTTNDVIVPSGNAVKMTKGNKPYTLYGWVLGKKVAAASKKTDTYYPIKDDGTTDTTPVTTVTDVREKTKEENNNTPWTPKTTEDLEDPAPTDKNVPTYYAVWYADKAKVAFDLNFEGATLDSFAYRSSSYTEDKENNQLYVVFDPEATAQTSDKAGLFVETKVTSPSMKANARPGYEFKGWSPNKDATAADSEEFYQFDFDYDYAGGTTYYAIWEKTSADEVTPATVTFDANGGEFTSTPSGYTKNDKVLTVEFATEDAADVAVPASSVLKRTGYKFLGWSPSKEGAADATLTKVNYNTGTVTFYAVWEKTSDETPSDNEPGKEEPGKEDSGNNNETPSANTTPSVNYVEKTVAAATVDGKSVSVCYASKQLYQGRKLKNFDAIDYITVNGVSYNGSKVVVKVSKGKDAGSKVTFLIKKIKGESKEFNKALKAQKLTYTVEIVPVD